MNIELWSQIGCLTAELFFYIEEGPLKDRLIDIYLEREVDDDLAEFDFEASVRIKPHSDPELTSIEYCLEAGEFTFEINLSIDALDADESADLLQYLSKNTPLPKNKRTQTNPSADGFGANIIRKGMKGEQGRELLNITSAACALGLSPRLLKTLIPCSEIRISEQGGNKTIEQYYWEMRLVTRLETINAQQKSGDDLATEDLVFIAEMCCDGDLQWAREVLTDFLRESSLPTADDRLKKLENN